MFRDWIYGMIVVPIIVLQVLPTQSNTRTVRSYPLEPLDCSPKTPCATTNLFSMGSYNAVSHRYVRVPDLASVVGTHGLK